MAQLEAEVEEAARRKAAADMEAARSLEAVRSELAAAQREVEVLCAGAGAEKDSALAALKVATLLFSLNGCWRMHFALKGPINSGLKRLSLALVGI